VPTGKLERMLIMLRHLPGAWWRNWATKALVVSGVVLAGAAVGCSAQPAVPRGSVNSCFQFGVASIRRHVTVTALPPACQGLSQLDVNVALDRALQAAAAGAGGKARQRQVIGRDSPYLAHLIRGVPEPAQPAAAAPVARPASRAALGWAALVAWLVTVGLGVSMMARWITRTGLRGAQRGRGRGRGPVLNFTHLGLALTGLLTWISYLATGVTGLAWAACGLLLGAASLGMSLVFLAGPSGDDPRPSGHRPAFIIAAHITAACITILLATLAAIGAG
jgi:hypothetical protein